MPESLADFHVHPDGPCLHLPDRIREPADALALFHELDDLVSRCFLCSEPVWLTVVRVCPSEGPLCADCRHNCAACFEEVAI